MRNLAIWGNEEPIKKLFKIITPVLQKLGWKINCSRRFLIALAMTFISASESSCQDICTVCFSAGSFCVLSSWDIASSSLAKLILASLVNVLVKVFSQSLLYLEASRQRPGTFPAGMTGDVLPVLEGKLLLTMIRTNPVSPLPVMVLERHLPSYKKLRI